MKEKHREPEVPEERVPVGECLDGPARITLKELAPIHSVQSGTLQNACSTRPRVVAVLVKSAHMHIARWMNSLAKCTKRKCDKSAVAMLKKHELYDRTEKPVVCRDTSHERIKHLRIRKRLAMRAQTNSNDFFFFELISRFEFDFRRRGNFF